MFTQALEFTIVRFDDSLRATPEFDRHYIARGQHVEDHLHVVTDERNSDEGGECASVPAPRFEHDSINFAFSNRDRGTS
ncbi:MAG TPA: hypothetical protein VII67_01420 [Acidimicrobiales bacterium]